jgi:hypothetical protein
MPLIDLTRYIFDADGTWTHPEDADDSDVYPLTTADTMAPGRLMLRWADDSIVLAGPLSVRITVQAENFTVALGRRPRRFQRIQKTVDQVSETDPNLVKEIVDATKSDLGQSAGSQKTVAAGSILGSMRPEPVHFGSAGEGYGRPGLGREVKSIQAGTIYSYTLDIPAGQSWPFELGAAVFGYRAERAGLGAAGERLGNNLGYRVLIEPALITTDTTPVSTGADLPCDFAVANQPDTAKFFPSACEPCAPGAPIGLPPTGAVALVTPPAPGGCVRTRFFNGMFISREDLETEQRYHRLKSKLHNRAAGAGVVWGLNVGKQGDSVVVLPGYGVDCCGNDLALTAAYKVDVAALLADPAAARVLRRGGPQRVHLLLEYVECPSDPRPVHGDACSPDVSRCEMSRIRETVRLRLVPPRDYDARVESAPIQAFLDEIRALRERTFAPQETASLVPDRAPFRLLVTLVGNDLGSGGQKTQTLEVRPSAGVHTDLLDKIDRKMRVKSASVDVRLDPMWTFVEGRIAARVDQAGSSIPGKAEPASQDLSANGTFETPKLTTFLDLAKVEEGGARLSFEVARWRAQSVFAAEDDPGIGSAKLLLRIELTSETIRSASLEVSEITAPDLSIGPPPCAEDRCSERVRLKEVLIEEVARRRAALRSDEAETPETYAGIKERDRFAKALSRYDVSEEAAGPPKGLPWLHPDVEHPNEAADPKVLVLAGLGAWLAQMLVREYAGTADEAWTTRRVVASYIYSAAWTFLFGVEDARGRAGLGEILKRLLEGWCDEALWRGPECKGDPHGVVIGSACAQAGSLTDIDPFGGRRNVVHYPLLAHWGAQLGLAPLDVTASRVFSLLCCVASLPAIGTSTGSKASLVELGAARLALGPKSRVQALLAKENVVSSRQAGIVEFVGSLVVAAQARSKPKVDVKVPEQKGTEYAALVLSEVVAEGTVVLLVPAREAPAE